MESANLWLLLLTFSIRNCAKPKKCNSQQRYYSLLHVGPFRHPWNTGRFPLSLSLAFFSFFIIANFISSLFFFFFFFYLSIPSHFYFPPSFIHSFRRLLFLILFSSRWMGGKRARAGVVGFRIVLPSSGRLCIYVEIIPPGINLTGFRQFFHKQSAQNVSM